MLESESCSGCDCSTACLPSTRRVGKGVLGAGCCQQLPALAWCGTCSHSNWRTVWLHTPASLCPPQNLPVRLHIHGNVWEVQLLQISDKSSEALWAWNLLCSNRILVFKHFFYDLLFSRCWSVSCFIFFDNLFPLKGLCFFH